MENCYNGIAIPTPVPAPCNGEYKSTDCILAPNALTYLGLPASSSQSEINAAIQASLMAKDELIAEPHIPDLQSISDINDGLYATEEDSLGMGSSIEFYNNLINLNHYSSGAEYNSTIQLDDGGLKIVQNKSDNDYSLYTELNFQTPKSHSVISIPSPLLAGEYVLATLNDIPEQVDSRPYKVYTALLTQNGVTAPVATVLENTIGDNIAFSYVGEGLYLVQLESSVLPLFAGAVLLQSRVAYVKTDYEGTPIFWFYIIPINNTSFYINTQLGDIDNNNLLQDMYTEIRVYN